MHNANPTLAREAAERRGKRSERDYLALLRHVPGQTRPWWVNGRCICWTCFSRIRIRSIRPGDRARAGPGDGKTACGSGAIWAGDLWGHPPAEGTAQRPIELHMAPEVAALLESRRILKEDIEKVIRQAEAGGHRFRHQDTGHWLACHRPYQAAFWGGIFTSG